MGAPEFGCATWTLFSSRSPTRTASRSPEHSHLHDSYIYLLSGRLIGTVAGEAADLRPGDTLAHPAGVLHTVQAVGDSHWLEFKTPLQSP